MHNQTGLYPNVHAMSGSVKVTNHPLSCSFETHMHTSTIGYWQFYKEQKLFNYFMQIKQIYPFDKAPVTWLKYCRYGVKHYPINQSIICFRKVSLYRYTKNLDCFSYYELGGLCL